MISEEKRKSRLAGPSSRKVKFTKAEDATLALLVKELGTKDWKSIAQHMQPRTARQCRERWTNYVNPTLSQEPWTQEEDILLIEKHCEFGNHWKIIERCFPSRSKNNIKHRWSLLQSLVSNTPPSSVSIISNTASTPNIMINPNVNIQLPTSPISTFASTDQVVSSSTLESLVNNDDIQINQSINIFSSNVSQHAQPSQQRLIQPIIQSSSNQIQPLMPQINRSQIQPQLNQINSIPLSVYLNTDSSMPDIISNQSPIIEEKPIDTFQYFDRILDTHEMYINEIDNGETWTYPDENSFFKIM